MRTRISSALFVGAACAAASLALAQDSRQSERLANEAMEVIKTVYVRTDGNEAGGLRRCRAYMEEAESAVKLGAADMAARHWDRAARGCRAEAATACRVQKAAAPSEQCQRLLR